MKFSDIVTDIFRVSVIADRIKSDEEKRRKSVRFAVSGIIYALVAAGLAVGGSLLFTVSAESVLAIFLIVIGAVLLAGALVCYIGSIVRVIAQLRINRRAIGWVALAVLILSFAGAILGVVLILA